MHLLLSVRRLLRFELTKISSLHTLRIFHQLNTDAKTIENPQQYNNETRSAISYKLFFVYVYFWEDNMQRRRMQDWHVGMALEVVCRDGIRGGM